MARDLQVRVARQDDVDALADVHLQSFQGFFLSLLGRGFLRELYSATLDDPTGIGLVVSDGNEVLGFVTGSIRPSGFYRRLLGQRWWRFALAAVPAVLQRPAIVPRLARAFSVPSQASGKGNRATLMSLAVRPDTQGGGIGSALVKVFLKEVAARGVAQVDLTTDRDNNDAVNRFYRNLGFARERTYVTPEGRAMNEYVIDLQEIVLDEEFLVTSTRRVNA